jgi:hypothetical protein
MKSIMKFSTIKLAIIFNIFILVKLTYALNYYLTPTKYSIASSIVLHNLLHGHILDLSSALGTDVSTIFGRALTTSVTGVLGKLAMRGVEPILDNLSNNKKTWIAAAVYSGLGGIIYGATHKKELETFTDRLKLETVESLKDNVKNIASLKIINENAYYLMKKYSNKIKNFLLFVPETTTDNINLNKLKNNEIFFIDSEDIMQNVKELFKEDSGFKYSVTKQFQAFQLL